MRKRLTLAALVGLGFFIFFLLFPTWSPLLEASAEAAHIQTQPSSGKGGSRLRPTIIAHARQGTVAALRTRVLGKNPKSTPTGASGNQPPRTATFTRTPDNPQLELSPSSGPALTFVIVSGSGFRPNAHECALKWDDDRRLGPSSTNKNGQLSGSFTVPSDAQPGLHTVSVRGDCLRDQHPASAQFDVTAADTPTNTPIDTLTRTSTSTPTGTRTPTDTPTDIPTFTPTRTRNHQLVLSPSSGPPLTFVIVSGSGLRANEDACPVKWNNRDRVGSASTDENGELSGSFTVPTDALPGMHLVSVYGDCLRDEHPATSEFYVAAIETPTDSATSTPTNTATFSPTNTPTDRPTRTLTNTPTRTGTIAPTYTPTRTAVSQSDEPQPTASPTDIQIAPSVTPLPSPTTASTLPPTVELTVVLPSPSSPVPPASVLPGSPNTSIPASSTPVVQIKSPATFTPSATPTAVIVALAAGGSTPPPSSGLLGDFGSTFFVKHIAGPLALLEAPPETLATNLALAIVLALLFGFFGLLLYDTLESHEGQLQRWLGPLRQVSAAGVNWEGKVRAVLGRFHLQWLGEIVQILFVLLVFGAIYSFVDPSFSFTNSDALSLLLAVTLSVGLVNLLDDIAKLIYIRRLGANASVRVHTGNLAVAGLLVLLSRFASLSPGLLAVGPGGLEGEERGEEHRLSLIGASGLAFPALAAWMLLLAFPIEGSKGTTLWIATVLSLVFAVGLQTVFFELIPVKGLYGRAIFKRNPLLWFALFAFFGFLFIQTQLNPDSSFVGAFNKPNMAGLVVFVLAFCLMSLGTYLYFLRKDRLESQQQHTEAAG